MLRMAEFCACLEGLGYVEPQTVLQSGNAVVGLPARAGTPARMESSIHAALLDRAGVDSDVFVRTAAEWQALVAANPLSHWAADAPSRFVAVVMRDTPTQAGLARLREAITGPEVVEPGDRVLYAWYPDGQGRSKLTGAVIERCLGTRGTARNWNTVLKLRALSAPGASAT